MRKFLLKHYYLTGFAVALFIIIGGSAAGVFIEVTYYQSKRQCVDNCSGIIILLSMMVSLVLGILAGLITALILERKQKLK